MAETVLGVLRELEGRAGEPKVKQRLAHHARETEGQIRNVQQAFASLGTEPQRLPCPAIEGLRAQGEQLLAESGSGLTDAVILSGCAQVEHHEIAVYSGLITIARQLHHDDVVELLEENLEQEEHTLQEVDQPFEQQAKQLAEQVSA
ncbi:MAG TPA: DUF892 family protein [Gaiellaceae bacterium]|nr:DUF892 family protein [Gaiellaceae bacterium]